MTIVTLIPVLKDNYAYLLETADGAVAIVDPGEAQPVIDVLEQKGLTLDYILNTHHHADHTAGNTALKKTYGAKLIAPASETRRIRNIDQGVQDSNIVKLGDEPVHVIETPGHTTGGVCFYLPESKIVFTGDTLFSMSCGRLFEGTPEQMYASLQKIAALPDDTLAYCGHEYTQDNARFALHIDPENKDVQKRAAEVNNLRARDLPTLPVSIATEKAANPFIRAKNAEEFSHLRRLKDHF